MNNTLTNKTLMSLSFIKVNWDNQRKKDYIDNFVPFLATLIVRKRYQEIQESAEGINKFIADFKEEFGLLIPYHPMITIINRARKKGIIKKQEHKFIPTDKVYKYDFSGKTKEQERKYEKIIQYFEKFARDNYHKDLTKNEVENILINFLKQYDLEMLFSAYSKSALPDVKATKTNMFIFSKFVENIYKEEPNIFQILSDITIGHVLVNIILYGSNAEGFVKPKLNQLNVYIDTKVIFRLFGIEGEDFRKVYINFLDELKKQGIKLFLFRHTYDEIMYILNNSLHWISNPGYDASKASIALKYFKAQGYKESDIQILINGMDKKLVYYGIKPINTPIPKQYMKYQIDEKKLHDIIYDFYQSNNYVSVGEPSEMDDTIWKDVKSISAVYKLRKGAKPQNIRQAHHIFMTINSGLAFVNKKFEREEYEEKFYIPTCVTDTFVGTLIWMRKPQKITEISERKLIANIYAALQPNEKFLKRYLAEVEKLRKNNEITEDDYILLRDSQIAKQMLTEETLGDSDNFTPQTPIEILEKIKKKGYSKYEEEKIKHEKTRQELERERKSKEKLLIRQIRVADITVNIFAAIILIIFIVIFITPFNITSTG